VPEIRLPEQRVPQIPVREKQVPERQYDGGPASGSQFQLRCWSSGRWE
jgi:hypothetical protein